MSSSLMATMIVRLMDPRDLSTPAWMTSAIEQLDAARGWTAQLKPAQDTAAKFAVVNEQADRAQAAAVLPSAVTDARKIAGAIKMASGSVSDVAPMPTVTEIASGWVSDAGSIQDSIPDMAKIISGSIPDTIEMASGAIPDAGSPIYAALPKVAPIATGTVREWSGGAVKVPGDFTSVTSGLSLDEIQRVSGSFRGHGRCAEVSGLWRDFPTAVGACISSSSKGHASSSGRSSLQPEPPGASRGRATDAPSSAAGDGGGAGQELDPSASPRGQGIAGRAWSGFGVGAS
jgi:hypothetical protein